MTGKAIPVGADETHPVVLSVIDYLERKKGYQVIRRGAIGSHPASCDWPNVAADVARCVAAGEAPFGILFCWTGTGVSIAANKLQGIRAALCTDRDTAIGARRWNDANILAMSVRLVTEQLAREIVDGWLESQPDGTEGNRRCLDALAQLDCSTDSHP